ncbi:saccharopine dehydrogenase family protein [Ketobacter sp.]|uniref:saccharopine dehydrogenase family protein n=1 Tax=Ketobacter sp. TaxID=2083498 RepID=UPI000F2C41B6|nr:saccharopine dehydrogenase NADP-binding domain-containing protein [Ketobacter sp.]RLT97462.1 MAG: saccharopine dehydrogenase [Ketobacter sp.]
MVNDITPKSEREFDVVLYGATSFVGRFVAEHLHQRQQGDNTLHIALAGRDANKLQALQRELAITDMPVINVDAADSAGLFAMASRAKVIASTVGPYARYGSALVQACAEAGTDYCDLTAELPWMRAMLDQYGSTAKASGGRIVHGCGFDSIPSDVGTWLLQQKAKQRFGSYCDRVEMRLLKARGGFSGGTAASLTEMVFEATDDPQVRAVTLNPYGLTEPGQSGPQQDRMLPKYDRGLGQWSAPFLMAPINTRVVQRSHAIAGMPWGENFLYDEAMSTGKGLPGMVLAAGATAALGSLIGLSALKMTRPLIKKILPKPGKGPSLRTIENGYFVMRATGTTSDGRRLVMDVEGEKDPGYGATARMLGEAALCLAADSSNQVVGGGFWTPSTAMGEALVTKLSQHAGIRFREVAQ